MANFYTAKKTINGTEYTAKFSGLSAALQAIDESYVDGTNNTSLVKLSNYIFKYVIVEPKGLTPDSFDSLEEFNEVVTFGREVMQGENKPTETTETTEETTKKK